jgi:hypothetical protein
MSVPAKTMPMIATLTKVSASVNAAARLGWFASFVCIKTIQMILLPGRAIMHRHGQASKSNFTAMSAMFQWCERNAGFERTDVPEMDRTCPGSGHVFTAPAVVFPRRMVDAD